MTLCEFQYSYILETHLTFGNLVTQKLIQGFQGGTSGKEPTCQCWRHKRLKFLGQEDPLEEGMATHSRTLAWRIPWTEESGGLQSTGSQNFRHD